MPSQRQETVSQRLSRRWRYGCNSNIKMVHKIGSHQRGRDIAFSTLWRRGFSGKWSLRQNLRHQIC